MLLYTTKVRKWEGCFVFAPIAPLSGGLVVVFSPMSLFSPLQDVGRCSNAPENSSTQHCERVSKKKKANKHRCGSWGITLGGALQSLVTDVARPTTRKRTGDGVREHTHTHHSVLLVLFVVRRALTKLTFKIKNKK